MRTSCLPWSLFLVWFSVLAACASSNGMQVLDSRPEGITLRYKENDPQLAEVTADQHCATYGKVSKLIRQKDSKGVEAVEDPGTAVFVFECLDAPAVQ